jgi:hypothetical protein
MMSFTAKGARRVVSVVRRSDGRALKRVVAGAPNASPRIDLDTAVLDQAGLPSTPLMIIGVRPRVTAVNARPAAQDGLLASSRPAGRRAKRRRVGSPRRGPVGMCPSAMASAVANGAGRP